MINLKCKIQILNILKRTKARGWSNVKEGDIVEITLPITYNKKPSNSGAVYQLYPQIKNINNGDVWENSMNQLFNILTETFDVNQIK